MMDDKVWLQAMATEARDTTIVQPKAVKTRQNNSPAANSPKGRKFMAVFSFQKSLRDKQHDCRDDDDEEQRADGD